MLVHVTGKQYGRDALFAFQELDEKMDTTFIPV